VNQETDDPKYQSTVAQVFYTRIKQGINLESNVTANYAAMKAGVPRNVNIDSGIIHICTRIDTWTHWQRNSYAMKGAAHPSNTDYVYFIAGDDGKDPFFAYFR
jgi:cell division protein YceG involved in septum cleavage